MQSSYFVWGAGLFVGVAAEEVHTIYFNNQFPTLIKGNSVLSTGGNYTVDGPLWSAIAYLQGNESDTACGFNGEGCTLIETSLANPTAESPGSGSSTDISLITPHNFVVPVAFRYFNGCDGEGAECCLQDSCPMAFRSPNDTWVQVSCQEKDVSLEVGLS
ncbi:glycopeptide [Mycena leptocephala]|nr:glycopeptide [Mycena leptocephala]